MIPNSPRFIDLGTHINVPLSFKRHIETIVSKALSKLGLINKIFKRKTMKNIVTLYKCYVRSRLEYTSLIWSPYTRGLNDLIERVQMRLCRLMPYITSLSYKDQLSSIGLPSLRARRLRFQLITFF